MCQLNRQYSVHGGVSILASHSDMVCILRYVAYESVESLLEASNDRSSSNHAAGYVFVRLGEINYALRSLSR
jgi:hypothetical protein